MSTSQPGAPRRRRIAGERRGRTAPEDAQTTIAPVVPPADPPTERRVLIEKGPREERVLAGSPADPATGTDAPESDAYQSDAPESDAYESDAYEDDELGTEPSGSDAATDLSGAGDVESDRPRGGWWGSRASLVILAGLLAALLALTGMAALGVLGTDSLAEVNERDAVERTTRTAPAAAEAAAAAILAYDWKTLDADQDAAARYMSEEFAAEYAETFEKVVRPAAEKNRAKVTATVLASSVINATESSATVLLFVDQATISRANPRPQIALNRVEMSMVRDGDGWLVADISSY